MKVTQIPNSIALCLAAIVGTTGCGGGSAPVSTGDNSPNYTTSSGQQVPNWRTATFQTNYQAMIQQLISHYGSNVGIGYIRIGLGRGGEINLPEGWNDSTSGGCYADYTTTWGYTAGADATFTWNAYTSEQRDTKRKQFANCLSKFLQWIQGPSPALN
jgi:hypothetical protein